jgi:hypothetical protein
MTYEYRCVAGPTIVAVKSAKARDQSVKAFEDIMNREAQEGWEYVGIDEFHVSEPQGLFTRKRVYVPSKILVFRRMKEMPVVVSPPAAAPEPAPQPVAPMLPPPDVETTVAVAEAAGDEAKPSIKAIADNLKAKRKG